MSKKRKQIVDKRFDYPENLWDSLHLQGVNEKDFELYLVGIEKTLHSDDELPVEPGVEYQMSSRFIINIHALTLFHSEKPILIHMKTCGGYWEEGMAIYDMIMTTPNPVTILNYTHARSMSSIFFQIADKRVMMPHSHFMFHEGDIEIGGTVKQVKSVMKFTERTADIVMLDIYSERLKEGNRCARWSLKRIRKTLKEFMDKEEDVYLTAEEAVEWGFADVIFDGNWNKLRATKKRDC